VIVSSVQELRALLNSRDDDEVGQRALWASLNDRLGMCLEKGSLTYVVRSWSDALRPRTDPATIFIVWDETEYTIFVDDELFSATDASQLLVPGTGLGTGALTRTFITAVALTFATRFSEITAGDALVSLSDRGQSGAVSFTGRSEEEKLIPDPVFIQTFAYEWFRSAVNRRWVRWRERRPSAIWRGQLTGMLSTTPTHDWSWLPRVNLCAVAESIVHSDAIDARLTQIQGYINMNFGDRLVGVDRYLGDRIEPVDLLKYRYMIDIDGWANAWSGLFQKLLTGSAVLKVESQNGYRQWYYDRLEPWVHYVPVKPDLSDLDDRLEFVLSNDEEAQVIGRSGRRLALSLSLEAEVFAMASVIEGGTDRDRSVSGPVHS
jgi:hypothetical protein